MKYYKLTDGNNQTYGGTRWGEGVTHKTLGDGKNLCSPDVIHVYDHPLKATLFNSIHVNFKHYNLWEVRIRRKVVDDGLKVGVKEATTIKQVELPVMTSAQRVRFAIYCSQIVYKEASFTVWAGKWLSGEDRARAAAAHAAGAAEATADDADDDAARAAAYGAEATARAAAAYAANTAAFRAAAYGAAAYSAAAAAYAAYAAGARARATLHFTKLAKKAIKDEEKLDKRCRRGV